MGKVKVCIFLFIVLLVSLLGISQIFAAQCGDVNSDGQINSVDTLVIAQFLVGEPQENFDEAAADANGDNIIDLGDGILILQYYVGNMNSLPCQQISEPSEPIAKFTVNPESPELGETVTIDASESYDPDGSVTGYEIDWGDGTITNEVITSHEYSSEGEYTILVTVIDNDGKTSTEEITISVDVKPNEVCELGRSIANRVAYNTLKRAPNDSHYAVACVWHGTLIYANLTQNTDLIDGSVNTYINRRPTGSVDDNVYGIWPLGLYQQTKNTNYLDTGVYLADEEFNPANSDGLCKYTRYWVDDLYMICSLQVQAYKATGDTKYLNRSKLQFQAYFNRLQQSNGLFHHTANAHYFWGRGNGWAASAMTEALMAWPDDYDLEGYNSIMNSYKSMIAALVRYQDSTGMWHQVITNSSSYLETSCTGMFIFAISTGIREGWLPSNEYLPVVERGIKALNGYVSSDGLVRNICIGTGQGSNEQFYLTRPTSTGDYHGQAGVLWGATGVMQLCE